MTRRESLERSRPAAPRPRSTTNGVQRSNEILAALDIDGTIAVPRTNQISQAVCVAVTRFRAAGHHVVLASGRSLLGVLATAHELDLTDGWVVASNGAITARLDSRVSRGYELEQVQNLDPGPVVRLARDMLPSVQIGAERIGWGYDVTHPFPMGQLNGAQQVVSLDQLTNERTTRLILRGPGVECLIGPVRAAGLTPTRVEPDWVDVTAPGLSKATALEKVRANLGVDPASTVAVGDGENDLEMLRWAACGIAMGHASALVRESADTVTGTLEEHGVAIALDALHG